MIRRIDFVETTFFDSRGRNGTMKTNGAVFAIMGETDDRDMGEACLRPITSRGDVSDAARIVVTSEAAGEIAAAFVEFYARYAMPEARRALAERLAATCNTGVDPVHADRVDHGVQIGDLPPPGQR